MIDKGTVAGIVKELDRTLIYIKENRNFHVIAPKTWNGALGDEITYTHFAVNAAWLEPKKIYLWIVIYHHRFGTDGFPVWQNEAPDLEQYAKEELENFEPDREDEYLELSGPFDIPSL
jgi:hypothetical protein